uniref:Uncharacterized protein n=1 Tax=Arundo donax TaxID=35708 RepID=A0A0A9JPT0_ARUDO
MFACSYLLEKLRIFSLA